MVLYIVSIAVRENFFPRFVSRKMYVNPLALSLKLELKVYIE